MIPVYCPLCCDQPFEDQDGLFHHLRSLRNNLFCPICSERFSSFDYLISHLSRKCYGPVSPHEAKRKALLNSSKLPDTLAVSPLVSPSCLDLGEVTSGTPPAKASETTNSGVICNSVLAASPAPLTVIPPEIRNRLPRGVTVSIGPSDTAPPQQSSSIGPSDTASPQQSSNPMAKILNILLENDKSSENPPVKSTTVNNSLSLVLNKVSLNRSVEISVKANKDNRSNSGKSFLKDSSSKTPVSVFTKDPHISPPSKRYGKVGPLSSKLKEITSVKNSLEVQIVEGPIEDRDELEKDHVSEIAKAKETISKEGVNLCSQDESTKPRKRGRPRKYLTNIDDDKSPVMNGVVNQEKSCSEIAVNKRSSRLAELNSSAYSTEEMSCKRSVKTRGKLTSYKKLVNLDESDFSLDDNSSSGDEYHEDEDPSSSMDENEDSFETNINEPNKKQDNKTKKIKSIKCDQTKPEPENRNSETTKTNLEPEKSSLRAEPGTKEAAEPETKEAAKPETKEAAEPETKEAAKPETKEAAEPETKEAAKPETKEAAEPKESSSVEEHPTEDEEEYTCSACNIRFTSIYEHIKEYHNGQEVVVEVPEEEIKEDLKAYQESSDSKVLIGESESTITPAIENGKTFVAPVKEEINSPQGSKKTGDKKNKEVTGFTAAGVSEDLVYTRTFKKVKKDTGEHWVQVQSDKKKLYQFVRDENKYARLMNELRNNTSIHPELNMPIKKLFENPKINVVEITYQPNSPFLTHRVVNFKNPMPMFIVDRQATNNPDLLGGIASYIMAGKETGLSKSETHDSKVIGVMKVILASDKELTVENIVFNDKPANPDMVPVLEEVKNPDIPLLKDAKILKWKCNKCLATTWKFPLHKETHFCNACPICHKTFISPVSLKKHLVLHKRDGTRYCKDCQASFVSKVTLNSHLAVHITHIVCDKCHLFVPRDKEEEHAELHRKDPSEQFPCSVCKKVFGSGQDLKQHETKLCSKLFAKFNCSHCDKKFFTLTALSYHTTAHNNVAVKVNCRFCPKTFIQEKEQCPKKAGKRKPSSFIQKKIWHERIHTRDRPYLCKSCPKRFRSMNQEQLHTAKVHTPTNSNPLRDVYVHMCTYCDRVFRSEKQLINHMTQHTTTAAE